MTINLDPAHGRTLFTPVPMAGRTAVRAVLALLLVAATLVLPAAPANAARGRSDGELAAERVLLQLHADARRNAGVAANEGWTDVRDIARDWSDQQAAQDRTAHGNYGDRMCCWSGAAENVGYVSFTDLSTAGIEAAARRLFDGWINSSSHRANVVDARFDQFGIGVTVQTRSDSNGTYGVMYATADFRDWDGSAVPGSRYYPSAGTIRRVGGNDAASTSVAVAKARFTTSNTVLLAADDSYPDALAAGLLAAHHQAPLLLTDPDKLDTDVRDQLAAMKPSQVIILGGPNAVSDGVERSVRSATGASTRRVAGPTRFETAVAAADEVYAGRRPDRVFIVEGAHADPSRGWPDAVSAGWVSARTSSPVLLTMRDAVPQPTLDVLRRLNPREIVVIGGTGAVSDAVANHLRQTVPGAGFARWAGSNRFATSAIVVELSGLSVSTPTFSTGLGFTSALVSSASSWRDGSAVLLVHGTDANGAGSVYDHIRRYQSGKAGLLVNSDGEIGSAVVQKLQDAIR